MEVENRDFLNSPPLKTVRFGGSIASTLVKLEQVSCVGLYMCNCKPMHVTFGFVIKHVLTCVM